MKRFSDRKICSMPAISLAKLALGRILFSDKSEAVKLSLDNSDEINAESLKSEDLFAVSDIKRNKDGGVDIKLVDMIKAIELMLKIGIEENENEESGTDFLEGFLKSAKQLSLKQGENEPKENENNQHSNTSLYSEEGDN